MANLKRKQIYLDEKSNRALKSLSLATRRISESEHIRRAVKRYVGEFQGNMTEDDPLHKLIGLCNKPEGPTDSSIHHDRYLYGPAPSV